MLLVIKYISYLTILLPTLTFIKSQPPTIPYPSFGQQAVFARDTSQAALLQTPAGNYIDLTTTTNSVFRCPPGYFCPENSDSLSYLLNTCTDSSAFCPEGSVKSTAVDEGYYSISISITPPINLYVDEIICPPGSYCQAGVKTLCPPGHYGVNFGEINSTCSGLCLEGFYCESGSTSMRQYPCGDSDLYCPPGSSVPIAINVGYYSTGGTETTRNNQVISEVGKYAVAGVVYNCPAGRYGATLGMSNSRCTEVCHRGYYCPAGSTDEAQRVCGLGRFCPERSSAPLLVREGYYTSIISDPCAPGFYRDPSSVFDPTMTPVQLPSVIQTKIPIATCVLCPHGMYKSGDGDDVSLCIPCPSVTSNYTASRIACACEWADGGVPFVNLNFNVDTGICESVGIDYEQVSVAGLSVFGTGGSYETKFEQTLCERGHYCIDAVRYPCTPGRYGSKLGETNALCSGVAESGYYTGEGAVSAREFECGDVTLFCPLGSFTPLRVSSGHYTNENKRDTLKDLQTVCPPGYYCNGGRRYKCDAGFYGGVDGNTHNMCNGACQFGHFCPEGSVSVKQSECGGVDVYCPTGSIAPIGVDEGYYTVPGQIDVYLRSLRESENMNRTMSAQKPCEAGYFCTGGIKFQCEQGSWSNVIGISSQGQCGCCDEGYYCKSHPHGPSLTPRQFECGSVSVFCAESSYRPTNVSLGYYTTGGDDRNTTRNMQFICEAGTFCQNGIKHACPEGTFGSSQGLVSPSCSGRCEAGSYCPEGSTSMTACGVGEYSSSSASFCISCGLDSVADDDDDGGQRCKTSRKCCSY